MIQGFVLLKHDVETSYLVRKHIKFLYILQRYTYGYFLAD